MSHPVAHLRGYGVKHFDRPNPNLFKEIWRYAAAEPGGACNLPPLLGRIAQSSFQSGVEIAPHLHHAFIAILTEER